MLYAYVTKKTVQILKIIYAEELASIILWGKMLDWEPQIL